MVKTGGTTRSETQETFLNVSSPIEAPADRGARLVRLFDEDTATIEKRRQIAKTLLTTIELRQVTQVTENYSGPQKSAIIHRLHRIIIDTGLRYTADIIVHLAGNVVRHGGPRSSPAEGQTPSPESLNALGFNPANDSNRQCRNNREAERREIASILLDIVLNAFTTSVADRGYAFIRCVRNGLTAEAKQLRAACLTLIDFVDYTGRTGLVWASRRGDVEMVDWMREQGAQMLSRDVRGRTALMAAAQSGHTSIAERLLAGGAPPSVLDNYGLSAAAFALAAGNIQLYARLGSQEEWLQQVEATMNLPPRLLEVEAFAQVPPLPSVKLVRPAGGPPPGGPPPGSPPPGGPPPGGPPPVGTPPGSPPPGGPPPGSPPPGHSLLGGLPPMHSPPEKQPPKGPPSSAPSGSPRDTSAMGHPTKQHQSVRGEKPALAPKPKFTNLKLKPDETKAQPLDVPDTITASIWSNGYPQPTTTVTLSSEQLIVAAILRDDAEVVGKLLANEDLVDYRPWERETLLMLAVERKKVNAIRTLLNHNCELNAYYVSPEGRLVTAMTKAVAAGGSVEVVEMLLHAGADVSIGQVLARALADNNESAAESIIENVDDWRPAMMDVGTAKGPATKTPLQLMLTRSQRLLEKMLIRLATLKKDLTIVLDTEILDASFVSNELSPQRLPIAHQIVNKHETLIHPVLQLYVHSKWVHLSGISRVHIITYVMLILSFFFYVEVLPNIKQTIRLLDTKRNTTLAEATCIDIRAIADQVETHWKPLIASIILLSIFFFVETIFILIDLTLVIRVKDLRHTADTRIARLRQTLRRIALKLTIPFLSCTFILVSLLNTCSTAIPTFWQRQSLAIVSVLLFLQLLSKIGRIPMFERFSVNLKIIYEMCSTLRHILLIFLITLAGYSWSYHLFFERTANFGTFPRAFVQTLLMMIGDFDFDLVMDELSSGYFDETCVLLVNIGSIVFMTLLLLNLFIGLVTADIERIKRNAKYESARMKIDYLVEDLTTLAVVDHLLRPLCGALHGRLRAHAVAQDKTVTLVREDLPTNLQSDFDKLIVMLKDRSLK